MRKLLALIGMVSVTAASFAQTSPFAINWSTYKSGQYSSVKTFQTFTMRSQSDFANYWSKSTGNSPATAPKEIDWLKYEALAIHLGERKTGGYSVSVRDIQMVRGDEYNVQAVEQVPARVSKIVQAVTSPFTIILLPRRYAKYNVAITKEQASDWNQGGGNGDWGHGGGGGGHHGDDDDDRDEGRRNGYRLIETGELYPGQTQMKMDVVRSKREWNRFWNRMDARVTTYGRSRSNLIDWDKNQVLILQTGQVDPGVSVEVTRVRKTSTGYQVYVTQRLLNVYQPNQRSTFPYVVIEVAGHTGKFDITVSTISG